MASERRNKVREDKEQEAPKRRKSRKDAPAGGRLAGLKALLRSERTRKIFGLLLVLTAAYLLVAFVSFLFTWRLDQDLMGRPWQEIFSPDVQVENWLGKFGALVAHRFIHLWFGLAAFTVVLWSFLAGIRVLLGAWLLPPRRTAAWTLMALLWLPAALGFLFKGEWTFLGGGAGHAINLHLHGWLGGFGTGALLAFTLAGFIVATFNPSFAWVANLWDRMRSSADAETEAEAAPTTAPVAGVAVRDPEPVAAEEATDSGWDDVTGETDADETATEAEEPEETALELETNTTLVEAPTAEPQAGDAPVLAQDSEDEGFSVQVAKPQETVLSDDELDARLQEFGEYDPKLDLSSYELPPVDLLVDHGTGEVTVTKEELEANKDRIVETLGHYNIGIEKIKATIGPTVTLYEIIPKAGVRISKIKNLEDDIALSLAALGIRIIAPIPGKGTIGIEVPNSKPQVVGMRAVVASDKFQNSGADLPIVLGKTISNETFVTDLAKMPHLLMAGATGQGKSVGLNAILVSLLYKKHPSQIKFVLVDPKKVELTLFNKIERHFLAKLPGSEEAS